MSCRFIPLTEIISIFWAQEGEEELALAARAAYIRSVPTDPTNEKDDEKEKDSNELIEAEARVPNPEMAETAATDRISGNWFVTIIPRCSIQYTDLEHRDFAIFRLSYGVYA